jgi:hypothetical protein
MDSASDTRVCSLPAARAAAFHMAQSAAARAGPVLVMLAWIGVGRSTHVVAEPIRVDIVGREFQARAGHDAGAQWTAIIPTSSADDRAEFHLRASRQAQISANRVQLFLDRSLQGSWSAIPSGVHRSDDSGDSAWKWTDESGRPWLLDDLAESAWTSALSVVFYGSSHLRELHTEIVRWNLGLPMGKAGKNFDLPQAVTDVGSRSCRDCSRCTKQVGLDGLDGVDLKACGPPMYRIVEELSDTVAIGFKTYIHTPLAEALFLERLTRDGLRHPDVLVVDCGVWGPRGGIGFDQIADNKVYDYKLPSHMDEVEYFVSWVHTHFPRSLVVWIFGFCEIHCEFGIQTRLVRTPSPSPTRPCRDHSRLLCAGDDHLQHVLGI